MQIVIDGYNVLKQIVHSVWVDESDRLRFIKELERYAGKKGHQIVLVFDGGLLHMSEKLHFKDVVVIYPGIGKTADEYIINHLLVGTGERLLVSSDRQLCRAASEKEMVSVDSRFFYGFLQQALTAPKGHGQKMTPLMKQYVEDDQEHVDQLMQEASLSVFVKKEDREYVNEIPSRMNKQEKKLFAIVKKL